MNIVRNACEAVAAQDIIKLKVNCSYIDKVFINVHNSGEPIASEVITKLFQPFFSTKPCGTGLGLAISKCIINAHNGELLISSELLTGTTVSVQLPVVIK
ncbi:ATP-binding protein [Nostoc sp.]|uniref:ATP-binding protein n=1 Tax=Nostoc sp. TaxID=1180 RepID=UPI002FFC89FC